VNEIVVERPDFAAFVGARGQALQRTAYLLTGDWALAEDLLQTALAHVYPRWSRIERDDPDAYVRKVLVNTWSSWWRRKWRGETPTRDVPDLLSTSDAYNEVDLRESVRRALEQLPARQRAVVVLRYFEDLSEADTAAALGCSVGAVKSHASRALSKLRESSLLGSLVTEETV